VCPKPRRSQNLARSSLRRHCEGTGFAAFRFSQATCWAVAARQRAQATQLYTRLTINDLRAMHAKFHPREQSRNGQK